MQRLCLSTLAEVLLRRKDNTTSSSCASSSSLVHHHHTAAGLLSLYTSLADSDNRAVWRAANPSLDDAAMIAVESLLITSALRLTRTYQAAKATSAIDDLLGVIAKMELSAGGDDVAGVTNEALAASSSGSSSNNRHIAQQLRDTREHRRRALNTALSQRADALCEILSAERCYITPSSSTTTATTTATTNCYTLDPRLLLFELDQGFLLRDTQREMVSLMSATILSSAEKDQENKKSTTASGDGRSMVQQTIMGAGKTTVIAPLLSLLVGSPSKRFVIQVVPPALLNASHKILQSAFSYLIPRQVILFDTSRSSGSAGGINNVDAEMEALFEFALRGQAIILTTPNAIKSLFLRFVEKVDNVDSLLAVGEIRAADCSDDAHRIGRVLNLWRSKGVLVLDEVDTILHPLHSELNFPIGRRHHVDCHPFRWKLPIHLFDSVFYFYTGRCSVMEGGVLNARLPFTATAGEGGNTKAPSPITGREILDRLREQIIFGLAARKLQKNPHLILLDSGYYHSELRPLLCDWAVIFLVYSCHLPPSAAEGVRNYLVGAGRSSSPLPQIDDGLFIKYINLTKDWLDTLLPHCLSKINRVSFGLMVEYAVKQIIYADNSGFTSENISRFQTAIPFIAKDEPSPTAEFAHPDIVIGLTIFAMRLDGIRSTPIEEICDLLVQNVTREGGKMTDRRTYRMYEGWVRAAGGVVVSDEQEDGGGEGFGGPKFVRDEKGNYVKQKKANAAAANGAVDSTATTSTSPDAALAGSVARNRQKKAMAMMMAVNAISGGGGAGGGEGLLSASPSGSGIPSTMTTKSGAAGKGGRRGGNGRTATDALLTLMSSREHSMDPSLEFMRGFEFPPIAKLKDDPSARLCFARIPEVIHWFLSEIIFPTYMKFQTQKLSACGQELGGNMLFKYRLGFSGTPSNLLPRELGKCHYEKGTDGRLLHILTSPSVVSYEVLARGWTVRSILDHVAVASPSYNAFIDNGALITGLTNIQVAAYLLLNGLKGIDAVVYLDEASAQMVLLRSTGKHIPLSECGVPRERRFAFYDQLHTTGIDIGHAPNAKAIQTLGKDMTFRDYAQGAYRMRGIEKGQSVHVLITPEVYQLVAANALEAGGGGSGSGTTVTTTANQLFGATNKHDNTIHSAYDHTAEERQLFLSSMVTWLITNGLRSEQREHHQLCQQNMRNVWRKEAFETLVCGIEGQSTSSSTAVIATAVSLRRPTHSIASIDENTLFGNPSATSPMISSPDDDPYHGRSHLLEGKPKAALDLFKDGQPTTIPDTFEAPRLLSDVLGDGVSAHSEMFTTSESSKREAALILQAVTAEEQWMPKNGRQKTTNTLDTEVVQEQEQMREAMLEVQVTQQKDEASAEVLDFSRDGESEIHYWPAAALGDEGHALLYLTPLNVFALPQRPAVSCPSDVLISRNYHNPEWEGHRRLPNVTILMEWIPPVPAVSNTAANSGGDLHQQLPLLPAPSADYNTIGRDGSYTDSQKASIVTEMCQLLQRAAMPPSSSGGDKTSGAASPSATIPADDARLIVSVALGRVISSMEWTTGLQQYTDTAKLSAATNFAPSDILAILTSNVFRNEVKGYYLVAVTLAEAESLRRIIAVTRSMRARGAAHSLTPPLPLGSATVRLYILGRRSVCIAATDGVETMGSVTGKGAAPSPSSPANSHLNKHTQHYPSQLLRGFQVFRFFNGELHFNESELNTLLRAFGGSAQYTRRLFFTSVLALRRRPQVAWSTSAAAIVCQHAETAFEYLLQQLMGVALRRCCEVRGATSVNALYTALTNGGGGGRNGERGIVTNSSTVTPATGNNKTAKGSGHPAIGSTHALASSSIESSTSDSITITQLFGAFVFFNLFPAANGASTSSSDVAGRVLDYVAIADVGEMGSASAADAKNSDNTAPTEERGAFARNQFVAKSIEYGDFIRSLCWQNASSSFGDDELPTTACSNRNGGGAITPLLAAPKKVKGAASATTSTFPSAIPPYGHDTIAKAIAEREERRRSAEQNARQTAAEAYSRMHVAAEEAVERRARAVLEQLMASEAALLSGGGGGSCPPASDEDARLDRQKKMLRLNFAAVNSASSLSTASASPSTGVGIKSFTALFGDVTASVAAIASAKAPTSSAAEGDPSSLASTNHWTMRHTAAALLNLKCLAVSGTGCCAPLPPSADPTANTTRTTSANTSSGMTLSVRYQLPQVTLRPPRSSAGRTVGSLTYALQCRDDDAEDDEDEEEGAQSPPKALPATLTLAEYYTNFYQFGLERLSVGRDYDRVAAGEDAYGGGDNDEDEEDADEDNGLDFSEKHALKQKLGNDEWGYLSKNDQLSVCPFFVYDTPDVDPDCRIQMLYNMEKRPWLQPLVVVEEATPAAFGGGDKLAGENVAANGDVPAEAAEATAVVRCTTIHRGAIIRWLKVKWRAVDEDLAEGDATSSSVGYIVLTTEGVTGASRKRHRTVHTHWRRHKMIFTLTPNGSVVGRSVFKHNSVDDDDSGNSPYFSHRDALRDVGGGWCACPPMLDTSTGTNNNNSSVGSTTSSISSRQVATDRNNVVGSLAAFVNTSMCAAGVGGGSATTSPGTAAKKVGNSPPSAAAADDGNWHVSTIVIDSNTNNGTVPTASSAAQPSITAYLDGYPRPCFVTGFGFPVWDTSLGEDLVAQTMTRLEKQLNPISSSTKPTKATTKTPAAAASSKTAPSKGAPSAKGKTAPSPAGKKSAAPAVGRSSTTTAAKTSSSSAETTTPSEAAATPTDVTQGLLDGFILTGETIADIFRIANITDDPDTIDVDDVKGGDEPQGDEEEDDNEDEGGDDDDDITLPPFIGIIPKPTPSQLIAYPYRASELSIFHFDGDRLPYDGCLRDGIVLGGFPVRHVSGVEVRWGGVADVDGNDDTAAASSLSSWVMRTRFARRVAEEML